MGAFGDDRAPKLSIAGCVVVCRGSVSKRPFQHPVGESEATGWMPIRPWVEGDLKRALKMVAGLGPGFAMMLVVREGGCGLRGMWAPVVCGRV